MSKSYRGALGSLHLSSKWGPQMKIVYQLCFWGLSYYFQALHPVLSTSLLGVWSIAPHYSSVAWPSDRPLRVFLVLVLLMSPGTECHGEKKYLSEYFSFTISQWSNFFFQLFTLQWIWIEFSLLTSLQYQIFIVLSSFFFLQKMTFLTPLLQCLFIKN